LFASNYFYWIINKLQGKKMLKDVLFITKEVFSKALSKKKNLRNPKRVYDVFRSFQEVISDVDLVANHYLALDFTEHYLQNSSFGEPVDKWRYFLNKDLEELNGTVKDYLQNLSYLSHDDSSFETYINEIFNAKVYYAFVRDNYNVGFVEQKGNLLHLHILKTDKMDIESFYIGKHKKIDLSTFEAKVALQKELNDINVELKIELEKLKQYIKNRYSLDDLLN
jgi:hypothetical protein